MRLVKLTLEDGGAVFVNPDLVDVVETDMDDCAIVNIGDAGIAVTEKVWDVVRLLTE